MQDFKKRLISAMLSAMCVVYALTGCQKSQSEISSDSEALEDMGDRKNGGERMQLEKDDNGRAKAPPIEIAGWLPENLINETLSLIEKSFPDQKIVYRYIAKTNYSSIIDIELADGRGPDIMFEDYPTMLNHASQEYIVKQNELGSLYSEEGTKNFTYKGDIYAIPGLCQYSGIYCNKDIFELYEMEIPKSYEDFYNVCMKCKENGIKPLSMGIYQWDILQVCSMAYVTADYLTTEAGDDFGEKYSKNQTSMRYTWRPYMDGWAKMVESEIITKEMLIEDDPYAIAEFADGKSAMLCGYSSSYSEIVALKPSLNFIMIPYYDSTGENPLLIGGAMYGFALNANSKNYDVAQQVLELLSTYDGQMAMWRDQRGADSYLTGVRLRKPSELKGLQEVIDKKRVYMPWTEWGFASGAYMDFGINLQRYIRGEISMDMVLFETDSVARSLINHND